MRETVQTEIALHPIYHTQMSGDPTQTYSLLVMKNLSVLYMMVIKTQVKQKILKLDNLCGNVCSMY